MSQFKLIGPRFILDLEPLSPEDFEGKHGISITAVEELAKEGKVLINLRVRNPERWRGMGYLLGLIDTAVVNDVRIDAFLQSGESIPTGIQKVLSQEELALTRPAAAFQYLIEELAKTPGTRMVTQPTAQKILELKRQDDWQLIKSKIFNLLRELTQIAFNNSSDPKRVDELRRIIKEGQRRLVPFPTSSSVLLRPSSLLLASCWFPGSREFWRIFLSPTREPGQPSLDSLHYQSRTPAYQSAPEAAV